MKLISAISPMLASVLSAKLSILKQNIVLFPFFHIHIQRKMENKQHCNIYIQNIYMNSIHLLRVPLKKYHVEFSAKEALSAREKLKNFLKKIFYFVFF